MTNCVPYSVRIELLVVKQLTLEKKMLFKRRKKSSPVDIEDFDFVDEAVPNVDRSEG